MAMDNAVSSPPRSPKPGKKYFNIDEANRSIGYVSRVVADLMRCYRHVVDVRRRIEHLHSGESQEHLEAQYETAMESLGDLVDELHQVGVELKDFEKGLVDFPAVHDDREIYLCWQYGEKTIAAWHEIDAGYAGRQDVKGLMAARKAKSRPAA